MTSFSYDLALNISAGLNESENPFHQAWNEQLVIVPVLSIKICVFVLV